MTKKFILIIFFTFLMQFSHCQIIDRYGFSLGASYSTQFWNINLPTIGMIDWDFDLDYKFGFMAFLSVEKSLGMFALRSEFGYIQKGFCDTQELTFIDGGSISSVSPKNKNVILHDLALNIGLKVTPFKFENPPYIFVGVRSDYLISYKDIVFVEPVSELEFGKYKSTIDDFTKLNFGGLLGVGIDIKEMFYLEVEYNPNFTKSIKSINNKGLSIKDNCFGVKLGININKLIK